MTTITIERIVEYLEGSKAMTIANLKGCPDSDYLKGQHFIEMDLLRFIKEGGKKVSEGLILTIDRAWLKD